MNAMHTLVFSHFVASKPGILQGLSSSIKDVASQADYPSLAHMVQRLSAYEQRHPDVYQDKFKCAVVLVAEDEDEGAAGDQVVAVAEWIRGASPVSCKWVKPQGPPKGFDFDVTKATTRKVAMADEVEVAPWLVMRHGRRFLVSSWCMSKLFFSRF